MSNYEITLLHLSDLLTRVSDAKLFYSEVQSLDLFEREKIFLKLYEEKNLIFSELETEYKKMCSNSKRKFQASDNPHISISQNSMEVLNQAVQIEYELIWNFSDCFSKDISVGILPVIFNHLKLLKSSKVILDHFNEMHKESFLRKEIDLSVSSQDFSN